MRHRKRHSGRAALAMAVAAALGPRAAFAAPSDDWIGRSGDWSIILNWSQRAAPVAGQDVNIRHNDDFVRVINYDYAGPDITLGTLAIDQLGKGTTRLSQAGFRLATLNTVVGESGRAEVVQSGGTSTTNSLILGLSDTAGRGDYTLSAGFLFPGQMTVGAGGEGNVQQTGGGVSVQTFFGGNGTLTLGQLGKAVGTYRLDAGFLNVANTVLGGQGAGTFRNFGGQHTSPKVTLGDAASGFGQYDLNAGFLSTQELTVGRLGRGQLTVNGTGSLSVFNSTAAATLDIASAAVGASGTVTVNAGSIYVQGQIRVGGAGNGRLDMAGGNVGATGDLLIDAPAASTGAGGTLHLTGGFLALSAHPDFGQGALRLGGDSATVLHEGGFVRVAQVMIAPDPGGAALYDLKAGSLDAGTLTLRAGGTFRQAAVPAAVTYIGQFIHDGGIVEGQLVNQYRYTYNSGSFPGKLVNQGTVVLNASLTLGGGLDNQAPLTLNGPTLTLQGPSSNQSDFTLADGFLEINGAFVNTNSGNMVARGQIFGFGTFQNRGRFTQGAGDLSMSVFGGQTNYGTVNLAPGRKFDTRGNVFTNEGVFNLNDATVVTLGGYLDNRPAGLITGPGALASTFNYGTIVVPAGVTRLDANILNVGSIILDSLTARIDGTGQIQNNGGSIHGRGIITARVNNNSGVVEAVGGTLTIASIPGTPNQFNQNGTLAAGSGSQLHFVAGLATNSGTILLTGGTFHDHGPSLINFGKIRGHGVFRATALNNSGEISVSSDVLELDTPITLASASKTIITGGGTATFQKNVSGVAGAEIRVSTNSAAVFLAPVTGPITFTGTGAKYFEAGVSAVGPVAAQGTTQVLEDATLVADHIREDTLIVTGKAAVRPNGTPAGTSKVNHLSIDGQGQLDLADNALIVDYTGASTINDIRSYLRSAYAGGAWNGPGLTSSSAAVNPSRSPGYGEASDLYGPAGGTFQGLPVDGSAVLVRFTIRGDANLDGAVSFPDLVALAQNYNTTNGTALWTRGDFTYDGNVDFNDLVALAQNYNTALPASPTPGAPAGFEDDLARAFSQVPEPALLTPLALLACGFAGQRRRRSRK
jgi:hypothetical protein